MNEKEIQDWLVAQLASRLFQDRTTIDIYSDFATFGLTSQEAVSISGKLEELLGQRLPPTLLYEYPSISKLSRFLAGNLSQADAKTDIDQKESMQEPIAVIGMSCRFPGAENLNAFWHLLVSGGNAISEIPEDRWSKNDFYDEDPEEPGKAISKWGGFLKNVDQFDPFFFGISPAEAKHMDPQQRLLLELSFEAIDHAGFNKKDLDGSTTGVFMGISVNEYSQREFNHPEFISSHSGTGSALSIAANRISYFYNLHGPSIAIDTACSSSLSAVHLACQSLRNGECNMAMAGGVNIILSPAHTIAFTKSGVLAPDGKCKSFDDLANGYVRGEGGGIVVLKPLYLAEKDRDPILAIIPGSAMAQDGHTNGLMAPSHIAQELLLRSSYRSCNITTDMVQYVEAHGTGTRIGDAMEASAIGSVIGSKRLEPCKIGSVKTNFGHLEAAAGIAGLIKVILAIKHGKLPASLHFERGNRAIDFDGLNLQVQSRSDLWPQPEKPLVAGVSSFGFGGTLVHVILTEPSLMQEGVPEESRLVHRECHILPLSANSRESLKLLVKGVQELIESNQDHYLSGICYAASHCRTQYTHRMACFGSHRDDILLALKSFLNGERHPSLLEQDRKISQTSGTAFVFSGQGGQWMGMGLELMRKEKVFREAVQNIDRLILSDYHWSVIEVLESSNGNLLEDRIDLVQPTIFTLQVALCKLWESWGITPDAVIGHSMGEVAAAVISGILDLQDGIRVICERSKLLGEYRNKGRMIATELSEKDARSLIKGHEEKVGVAAVNGPQSTVLSGDPSELEKIMKQLEDQNLFCSWVKVNVASHSPQMMPLRDRIVSTLGDISLNQENISFYSTVSGSPLLYNDLDAYYWADNLINPVLFSNTVRQVMLDGYHTFVEIGPHPVLLGAIQQSVNDSDQEVILLPSTRRDQPEDLVMCRSLGQLYIMGRPVTWEGIYHKSSISVELPPLGWQHQRYWLDQDDNRPTSRFNEFLLSDQKSPLLGRKLDLPNNDLHIWQSNLRLKDWPLLAGHRIHTDTILPGSAYIEMAMEAARILGIDNSHSLINFRFRKMMVLEDNSFQVIQNQVSYDRDSQTYRLEIYGLSASATEWQNHASASFTPQDRLSMSHDVIRLTPARLLKGGPTEFSTEHFYASLSEVGLQYGPSFRNVRKAWRSGEHALGLVKVLDSQGQSLVVNPALLDACFQIVSIIELQQFRGSLYIPVKCDSVRFFNAIPKEVWSLASLVTDKKTPNGELNFNIRLFDLDEKPLASIGGFTLKQIAGRPSVKEGVKDLWPYELRWKFAVHAAHTSKQRRIKGKWLILADEMGIGSKLAEMLQLEGDHCEIFPIVGNKNLNESSFSAVVEELLSKYSSFDGIIHLWSLSGSDPDSDNRHSNGFFSCVSLLYLIQILGKRMAASPKLWLITSGAQAVLPTDSIAVEQACIWGLGKTISLELPEWKCRRIDLDPSMPLNTTISLLVERLGDDSGEDQIAFRDGKQYIQRIVPYEKIRSDGASLSLARDRSYLITGGLGGLGLALAEWMFRQGARYLILIGRHDPGMHASRTIEKLRSAGMQVQIVKVDVSDDRELSKALSRVELSMPAIAGVVHAAGILDDGAIYNLDGDRMKNVMAPKVQGTWNLHTATYHLPLDFFVLFSSAVSVLGSPGQANYAAASAYLDAMAHYRRNLGLPALTINWGPWADIGLAASVKKALGEGTGSSQHLVKLIKPEQGLSLLGKLLVSSPTQLVVLPFDLKNLIELYPPAASIPFFSEVGGRETHVSRLYARPALKQDYVAPRNEIEQKVAELWQKTLHIDRVGVHDSFFELGGDSVLAAQILALARKIYGISIDPQEAFKAFTIEKLASILESEIYKQIENMSDEEAQRLLS